MEIELLNILLVLIAAWLGGAFATKLGYPPILGELLIGILLGPSLVGALQPSETTAVLAEVGILLMMLYVGMEIDYRDLGKASWAGLLAATGGFIVPFGLGYYTIIAFGGTPIAALFTAIAVGVTSLTTKSRILVDLKLLNTRIANVLMAGALISDTFALIIFAGIVSFTDKGTIEFTQILVVAGKAIGFFVTAGLIGFFLLPFLGRQIDKVGITNRTLYFTVMLIIALGFAELAELAGLHHILGTFIAGLFLKDSVISKRLSQELNNVFRDISIGFLAPIFFVTAGFEVTFDVIFTDLALLLTILFVATAGKILGTALFYLPSGYGWREGITVGAGMNGRGAVEIIIAGIALKAGYISADIFSILVFMAIFTTTTVPILLGITTKWLKRRGELVLADEKKKGLLFLGAGPLARYLAKQFAKHQPVIMIDSNKDHCRIARAAGLECINGNGLKEEVLAEAKANEIRSFVSLTGNSEINVLAAQVAHEAFLIPNIHVLLSPSDEAAHVSLLEPIGGSTIFSRKIELNKWDHKIQQGNFTVHEYEVQAEVSPRKVTKELITAEGEVLPVSYTDGNGNMLLFHYDAELEKGWKVQYLK